jgi:protoheme IX farnesyltransferase
MFLGAADSALVYNRLSKRKTCLNILLGAPAGGMPLLVTWAALRGQVELLPLLMAALIVIWTPTHIWSLAIYHKEDYNRAAVPMLPNVLDEKRAIRLVAAASLLLIIATFGLKFLSDFGTLYTITAILLALILGFFAVKSILKPSRRVMWQLFKVTSPYLFIIFLMMVLDSVFKF